jgi:predicted benzoate:H+ symporter BenE
MQSISWACCGLLVGWAVTAQLDQTKPRPIKTTPGIATLQASNYQPPARPDFFPGP